MGFHASQRKRLVVLHHSQHEGTLAVLECRLSQHEGPLNLRADAKNVSEGYRRYDPDSSSEV